MGSRNFVVCVVVDFCGLLALSVLWPLVVKVIRIIVCYKDVHVPFCKEVISEECVPLTIPCTLCQIDKQ